MKIQYVAPLLFVGLLLITGCSEETTSQNVSQVSSTLEQIEQKVDSKIHIVTSFYPLAELAQQVGGEYVNVNNLVPAGAEPHDFEPLPKDILALNTADLVIINGAGFEPWVEKIIPELESKHVKILDVSKVVPELLKSTEEGDEREEDHERGEYDPHFWIDPVLYLSQAQAVKNALIEINPSLTKEFSHQGDTYIAQLQSLDNEFKNGLGSCKQNEIVTNHAAFGYLAKRYNLTMLSISGLSPDSEPSAKRMGEITELVKKDGVKVIFTESLVSPKISETLAKEAGVQTMVLNPIEGLTEDQIKAGENYITVMKLNLQSLRTALECT